MGISYEELLKIAEIFKERAWYFFDVHQGKISEEEVAALKEKINGVLDAIDELPFEN